MRCKGGKGANSGAALNIISADDDRLVRVIQFETVGNSTFDRK